MRVRNERSNDIYRPSHDAACGLVFSWRDHVGLLNALIGTLARPGAILQMDWSQVDFDAPVGSAWRKGTGSGQAGC
jgi:hypothetical protein